MDAMKADPHDQVFRAIGHAGRRALLTRLGQDGGATLSELSASLDMTRQGVSQHLALLEEAGLVVTRRHGREKLHYLNPVPLLDAQAAWITPLVTDAAKAMRALRAALEAPGAARSARSA